MRLFPAACGSLWAARGILLAACDHACSPATRGNLPAAPGLRRGSSARGVRLFIAARGSFLAAHGLPCSSAARGNLLAARGVLFAARGMVWVLKLLGYARQVAHEMTNGMILEPLMHPVKGTSPGLSPGR